MAAYVKIYCKKSKAKANGLAPIYLALRINNKEKLISTGKYVEPEFFDNKKEQVKKGSVWPWNFGAFYQFQ